MNLAELTAYFEKKLAHARVHGGAVCESFDLEELEIIVAALKALGVSR